ncbi:uncharacterized protein BJ171DRAFT_577402 [Polychytrium aggregatum]|uniref:uncharacterized protein n=1 Tax=Polychytrium aggregatum TaxID=110093 RepID=UPI0022FEF78E|nr:uncharacterized protein BJ171DRAFT_577402 [Polychytrium aggregatum]KAI9209045.1 hypothetical protein BJ171DRAFT_577402 [Polychytrium aggregatum]
MRQPEARPSGGSPARTPDFATLTKKKKKGKKKSAGSPAGSAAVVQAAAAIASTSTSTSSTAEPDLSPPADTEDMNTVKPEHLPPQAVSKPAPSGQLPPEITAMLHPGSSINTSSLERVLHTKYPEACTPLSLSLLSSVQRLQSKMVMLEDFIASSASVPVPSNPSQTQAQAQSCTKDKRTTDNAFGQASARPTRPQASVHVQCNLCPQLTSVSVQCDPAVGQDDPAKRPSGTKGTQDAESLSWLVCAICLEIMVAPHTIECGHSFCFGCIRSWLQRGERKRCPTCRGHIEQKPVPTLLLRHHIDSIIQSLPDGPKGKSKKEHYKRLLDVSDEMRDPWGTIFAAQTQAVLDHDDGVRRCGSCGWEITGTECINCGQIYDHDEATLRAFGVDETDPYDEYTNNDSEQDEDDEYLATDDDGSDSHYHYIEDEAAESDDGGIRLMEDGDESEEELDDDDEDDDDDDDDEEEPASDEDYAPKRKGKLIRVPSARNVPLSESESDSKLDVQPARPIPSLALSSSKRAKRVVVLDSDDETAGAPSSSSPAVNAVDGDPGPSRRAPPKPKAAKRSLADEHVVVLDPQTPPKMPRQGLPGRAVKGSTSTDVSPLTVASVQSPRKRKSVSHDDHAAGLEALLNGDNEFLSSSSQGEDDSNDESTPAATPPQSSRTRNARTGAKKSRLGTR